MSQLFDTLGRPSVIPDDLRFELNYSDKKHFLWPALIVLSARRSHQSSPALVDRISSSLRTLGFMQRSGLPPNRLRAPAAVDDVLAWLSDVWRRMAHVERIELIDKKRMLIDEILESGLSSEEQSTLVTAVDYLHRLRSAQLVATAPEEPRDLCLPVIGSEVMQGTYRKLVGLSTTDLPIWLAGEKGTELAWAARFVHLLRGLPEDDFLTWDPERSTSPIHHVLRDGLMDEPIERREATVICEDLDKKGEACQKSVHEELLRALNHCGSGRLIVTSAPILLDFPCRQGMRPELWAFLAPTLVEIPPLRKRIEDVPALMNFFSRTHDGEKPSERLNREASALLEEHNWPGNVDELQVITNFILEKRPTGTIRAEHLPDSLRAKHDVDAELMHVLLKIQKNERFRALKLESGRIRLARFLISCSEGETFSPSDVQRVVSLGRETARRHLQSLEEHGLIEGLKGAGGKRITRYKSLHGTGRQGSLPE
jgi:DNA-binding transcriptional ArsR family regulator